MYEEAKVRIESAIVTKHIPLRQRSWGIKIKDGRWVLEEPILGCCALGVVLAEEPVTGSFMVVPTLTHLLNVPEAWIKAVELGFDNVDPTVAKVGFVAGTDGYEFGVYLRRKYLLKDGETR